jgi:hypothetical protein
MANLRKVGSAYMLIIFVAFVSASAAHKPDEFGDVCWRHEKEILRNFAIMLQNEPEARAYLVHYGGRRTPSLNVARVRGQRAKKHLAKLGISPERIVAVDGGFREEFTWQVWSVPKGANAPMPEPTVERREVKVTGIYKKSRCPRPQEWYKASRT